MKAGTGPGGMACIGFSSATGALRSVPQVEPRNMEQVPLIQKQGMRKAEPMPEGERARRLGARAEQNYHAVAKHR
jgi:hypothetical protein